MIKRTPTIEQENKVIEVYHRYPTKEITLEMLKSARAETGLGLYEVKMILVKYIRETYSKRHESGKSI